MLLTPGQYTPSIGETRYDYGRSRETTSGLISKESAATDTTRKNTLTAFIRNDGQRDASIFFEARASHRNIFFSPSHVTIVSELPRNPDLLRSAQNDFAIRASLLPSELDDAMIRPAIAEVFDSPPLDKRASVDQIEITFPGSRLNVEPVGANRLPGVANFYLGRSFDQWHENVPAFDTVRYPNLYPGIDLVYRNESGHLKAEWVASPGSDPMQIRIRYEGESAHIAVNDGELSVVSAAGILTESTPLTYQYVGTGRQTVRSEFRQIADSVIAIELGSYIHSEPLIIDPTLLISTYISGSSVDYVNAIAVDLNGNIYTAGASGVITKLSSSGALVYSTYVGDSYGSSITVNAAGHAYMSGYTSSATFPTLNPIQGSLAGSTDAFIVELSATGTLMFSTYIGGNDDDRGFGIAIDNAGNIIVGGVTNSHNFPVHSAIQGTFGGGGVGDAFIAKISANHILMYSTYFGGTGDEYGRGVGVDNSGNAYLTGYTTGANFPVVNAFQPIYGGGDTDAFVAKFDPTGTLVYSSFLGGFLTERSASDRGGIAVDSAGNAYVTGVTGGGFPELNSIELFGGGGGGAFITKIGVDGRLVYSSSLGPGWGNAIAVDVNGNAYVGGEVYGIPRPTFNAFQPTSAGNFEGFIVKISTSGSPVYSSYIGGSGRDGVLGVAVDALGNAYLAGYTVSLDFPIHAAFQPVYGGSSEDGFVAKVSSFTGSTATVSPHVLPADNVSMATITVTLRNGADELLPNRTVLITSDRGGFDSITNATSVTNASGQTVAAIRSTVPGTSTISVVNISDGPTLMERPTLQFTAMVSPPAQELHDSIDQLDRTSRQQLGFLQSVAQDVGVRGDYFRGKIGAASAALAWDTLFGIVDLGSTATSLAQPAVQIAQPGIADVGSGSLTALQADFPQSAQLFNPGLQPAIQVGNWSGLARPVLQLGDQAITEVFKDQLKDFPNQVIQDTLQAVGQATSGISTVAAGINARFGGIQQELTQQHDTLVSGVPGMAPAQQSLYAADLQARAGVPIVLANVQSQQHVLLDNLQTASSSLDQSVQQKVTLSLLKFIGQKLSFAAFDGPGALLFTGTTTNLNLYLDNKQLDTATRGYLLAAGELKSLPESGTKIYSNEATGFERVGRLLPTHTLTGQISAVQHISQGFGAGPIWYGDTTYSDISVTNTSSDSGTYEVIVQYGYVNTLLAGAFPLAYLPLVAEGTPVTLAPNQTQTVRVYYKQGATGGSPQDGSNIGIDVLATNATGTFYIGHRATSWNPQRVFASSASGPARTTPLTSPSTGPAIETPIDVYVTSDSSNQTYRAQLFAANPFSQTISVTVTQAIPAGVSVISTDGSTSGSTITWLKTIAPSQVLSMTLTFREPALPGTTLNLPAAIMSFVEPSSSQSVAVPSNVPTFTGLWPVTVSGYAPPGFSGTPATMPVTVTNVLNQSVSGSVTVVISGTAGTQLFANTLPFTVAASANNVVTFTLPGNLQPGLYPLQLSLNAGGTTLPVRSDTYQVLSAVTATVTPTATATVLSTATATATSTVAASTGLGTLKFINPVRVVDTRGGTFGLIGFQSSGAPISAGQLPNGTTTRFKLGGQTFGTTTIPADTTGVLLNVTLVQAVAAGGFLTVYPGDISTPPNASTVNPSTAIAANFWSVGLPTSGPNAGTVAVYSAGDPRDVILDLVGYYSPSTAATTGNLKFVTPVRVLDTRACCNGPIGFNANGTPITVGQLTASTTRQFSLANHPFGTTTFPADLSGILAHVTIVQSSPSGGFVTLLPGDASGIPNTSTVNPSSAIAFNSWAVGIPSTGPSAGMFGVYSTNALDVIVDVVGFYAPSNPASVGNLTFITPTRVFDTRGGNFGPIGFQPSGAPISAGQLANGSTTLALINGQSFANGSTGLPADTKGVLANVTLVQSQAGGGFVTVYPGDAPNPPNSSTVNPSTAIAASFWWNGVPNAPVANPGTLAVFSAGDMRDVIVDVVGYFR